MIVDIILDRKDGFGYSPRDLYEYCMDGEHEDISRALDCGTNEDIQKALCDYIRNNDYNEEICEYIASKDWLQNE